jgi:uncharacterized membrane protein
MEWRMLVAFPIGLWIFSFVCDLISIATAAGPEWERVALYALGGGIVGALLAALPGLVDLLSLSGASRTTGIRHMILNLAALIVFGASFWLRLQPDIDGARTPIVISGLGVLLILAAGWLGAEMVFVQGVASADRRVASPRRRPADVYTGPERRADERVDARM